MARSSAARKSSRKPRTRSSLKADVKPDKQKVLLFGGGGKAHDAEACCPVLKRYLDSVDHFEVDQVLMDYDVLRAGSIKQYGLVVFYTTAGQLNVHQKRGLVEAIADGRGFVGVHGAADTFRDCPEYHALLGGTFRRHPFMRDYPVSLNHPGHPVTADIPGKTVKDWEEWPVYEYPVHDEQYLLDVDSRVQLLASTLFRGRTWPVAWAKPWGTGRVFYLALGHNEQACRDTFFEQMFLGGARWAARPEPWPPEDDSRFAIV